MLEHYRNYLRFFIFEQELQNCFSLQGDGLAYASENAFFHSHQGFLKSLNAMSDEQGGRYSSYVEERYQGFWKESMMGRPLDVVS